MKKLICDVCGKEIKDESIVKFNENGIAKYTHASNDGYNCERIYKETKFFPTYYVNKKEKIEEQK